MQYYAVVNSAIIAAATGLAKDTTSIGALLLCATLYFVGGIMALIGITAIHKGRDYYQETILKKTVYEELLGLNSVPAPLTNPKATLAIGTTSGMQEVQSILAGRPAKSFLKRLVRNRIVSYFTWFLLLLAIIDVAGVFYSSSRALEMQRTALRQAASADKQAAFKGPGPQKLAKPPADKGAPGQTVPEIKTASKSGTAP